MVNTELCTPFCQFCPPNIIIDHDRGMKLKYCDVRGLCSENPYYLADRGEIQLISAWHKYHGGWCPLNWYQKLGKHQDCEMQYQYQSFFNGEAQWCILVVFVGWVTISAGRLKCVDPEVRCWGFNRWLDHSDENNCYINNNNQCLIKSMITSAGPNYSLTITTP